MNPAFKVTGPYSGTHKTYGHQTCITYAGGFTAKDGSGGNDTDDSGGDSSGDDSAKTLTDEQYRTLDQEVLAEQNKVRQNPKYLVPFLEAMLPNFDGLVYKETGKTDLVTNEGAAAVQELIDYLNKAPNVPALRRLQEDW